jgi:hypothetical protein
MDQKEIIKGGSFLIEQRTPAEVFTPEDFNEEHRMIADTTRQFMDAEVLPRIDELEAKDWKLARQLVKQAADLGLVGAGIPEEYGGLALDQTSSALIRREPRAVGFVCDDTRRAERYRPDANRLFRHRGSQAKVPAEDCRG